MALWHAGFTLDLRLLQLVTVQYLRGFAASLIVLHHALAHPLLAGLYDIAFAQIGVDIFFVVSGVIMWVTTDAKTFRTPWLFWRARIVRVVPLYWLTTAAYIAAAILVPGHVFQGQLSAWHVVCSFLFIPTQSPLGVTVPVYSLGWTLNYEMFFYFLFGLCLPFRSRPLRLVAIFGLMLALVLARYAFEPHNIAAVFYTDPIVLEFLCGAMIGALFLRYRERTVPAWIAPLTFAGAIVLFLLLLTSNAPRTITFGTPAVIAVAAALLSEMTASTRTFALGRALGDASYSIYLVHPFVLRPFFMIATAFFAAPTHGAQLSLVVMATGAGIIGGVIYYRLIERPLGSLFTRGDSKAGSTASGQLSGR